MPLIIPIPAYIFYSSHTQTQTLKHRHSLSLNMAAADSFLRAMDRLWFHQIILYTGSTTSQLVPKSLAKHQLMITKEESLTSCPSPSSSSISLATLPDEETSSIASPLPEDDHQISPPESPPASLLDESSNEEDNNDVIQQKEWATRSNFVTSGARSHPSSPSSTQKRCKNMRRSSSLRSLSKSTSYKTLGELELEEVKGFMDLGFVFKKESLSPRMMSVIPGLQRLEARYGNEHNATKHKDNELGAENNKLIREEEGRGIIRPYLSEAWLIKRPDSPLLNLRVPRVSAAADMKKHLKFWARTVASVIQQESC